MDGAANYTQLALSDAIGANDCTEGDVTKWQNLTGYQDTDGDGYGNAGAPGTFCSGPLLSVAGYVSNNSDCADNTAYAWQNVPNLYWFDQDQDTYTTGGAGTGCVGNSAVVNTIWGAVLYYQTTSAAYNVSTVSHGGDCYDGNYLANPTEGSYFTTNRGDGSFDYDCNGVATPQYPYTVDPHSGYCSGTYTTDSSSCGVTNSYCAAAGQAGTLLTMPCK